MTIRGIDCFFREIVVETRSLVEPLAAPSCCREGFGAIDSVLSSSSSSEGKVYLNVLPLHRTLAAVLAVCSLACSCEPGSWSP